MICTARIRFLEKYKKNHIAINDYNIIHWRGIGNTRKRLSIDENTRLMKYINGWLHTGRQKGLFGHGSACPCCGHHEETQIHIMQCPHAGTAKARKGAFKLLEKYYHQHKVPASVYVPFVKLCWAAIEDSDLHVHDPVLPSVETAIMNQKKLGGEFLLQGYLTRDWLVAIMQVEKCGKAELRLTHLYLVIWETLFEAVWEQRNEMLHGKDGIVDVYERQQLIVEMKEWKRQAPTRLGSKQQFLVTFSDDEILN